MITISRTVPIPAAADGVWPAVADVGAVHRRLARGFVTDTRLDGDHRTVTFDGGAVVTELVLGIDEEARRVTYSVIDSTLGLRHHRATMEVQPDGAGSRLVWTAEVEPDSAAEVVGRMMDRGVEAMRATLPAPDDRPNVALAALTFDCSDALLVAAFWSRLLGRPLDGGASAEFASIGMAEPAGSAPTWMFARVPEPKTAKNRCHPDLSVAADEHADVLRAALEAGAHRLADHDEHGFRWTTLADPEGNEFDLVVG